MSDRELAEKHWIFIEKLLKTYRGDKDAVEILESVSLETCHMLYVEALIHGIKHGKELGKE